MGSLDEYGRDGCSRSVCRRINGVVKFMFICFCVFFIFDGHTRSYQFYSVL